MNKSHLLRFLLIILMGSFLPSLTLHAQENDDPQPPNGLTLTAVAGYDGFYKPDHGLPVIVNVANNGPAIEGYLQLVVGGNTFDNELIYKSPISLPTQSEKRVPLYIHLPSAVNRLTVELRDNNNDLIYAVNTNTLNQTSNDSLLYGVVSPDPGEYSFLESVTGTRARAEVAFLDLAQLPDVPAVWNALDILVIDEVDTAELTTAQLDALIGWVHTGGQLVVAGGPGWQKSTAVTVDLLPVTPTGSESVDDLPALSQSIGDPFRDEGPYIITTSTLNGGGELLYHQDGLPILARQDVGQGGVYFLALDPKLAPLRDWDGSDLLWAVIATFTPDPSPWTIRNSYSAATAVSSLPSLALPSTLQLVLFLLIYVIIVGPVNYFVLKRRGRLERSWITIPIIVICFTVIAYFTGFQLKGNDIIINQMAVAQGQMGSDYMRVQTPLGIYSPKRGTYDIQFDYTHLARPFDRGSTPMGGSGNIEAITRSSQLTMSEARVDISDVATFVTDSYQPLPDITGQATMHVDGQDIVLDVDLRNNTDIELENAVVFLGQIPFSVGDIDPGEEQTISEIVGNISSGLTSSSPYYGSGSGQPLLDNATLILGTSNYYDDRDAYPRWELLQAIQGDYYSGGASTARFSVDEVTLVTWAQQSQVDVMLDAENIKNQAVTLYLLEIPFTQEVFGSDEEVSVPSSLLNWTVLGTNGIYNPTPFNFYMGSGWVEFEFQPWQEFQDMDVQSLTLVMEPQYAPTSQLPPLIFFWNWQTEEWDQMVNIDWGQEPVAEYRNYVGSDATMRIRIENNEITSVDIGEIYPLLTGTLE